MPAHRPPRLLSQPSPARPVSSTPPAHRPSQSPFRYLQVDEPQINEKQDPMPLADVGPSTSVSSSSGEKGSRPAPIRAPTLHLESQHRPSSSVLHHPSWPRNVSHSPRSASAQYPPPSMHQSTGLRLSPRLKLFLSFGMYGITSLGFLLAISFWKDEVFSGLDQLSLWLREEEYTGYAVIFFLIFLTTFPPLPLYSTLIALSGYSYGPWTGAVISYFAALSGAVVVFLLSRTYLRNSINGILNCSPSLKRVCRAIEKRPRLLFLIRLAPYPYNVMNVLLAASPTLTFRTYTVCTALSLFKVIIHTTLGASIHSFADYHRTTPGSENEKGNQNDDDGFGQFWTIFGIGLCIATLVYLSYVARKAVDDELDEDVGVREEREAFLSAQENDEEMSETPFRSRPNLRSSNSASGSGDRWSRFALGGREETDIGLDFTGRGGG